MNKVTIYGLFNPLTAECFYIGKTIQPKHERNINKQIKVKKQERDTNRN